MNSTRCKGVVIGLTHRPRWESQCREELSSLGIDVDHFEAFDGHSGVAPPMAVNNHRFIKSYKHTPLPGEIGCYASHILIARSARELPVLSPEFPEWRLVFEDDAMAVDMDAETLLRITGMAVEGGFDIVLLHTGRKNQRGKGEMRITRTKGEIFTHAYLMNLAAADFISGWEMQNPIDHAISKSKKLRIGVLWGQSRFTQRSPRSSEESIHRERKALTSGLQPIRYLPASATGDDLHKISFSHLGTPGLGRLGNQMFQIASTCGLAALHGMQPVIPRWSYSGWFEDLGISSVIPEAPAVVRERTIRHHGWGLPIDGDVDVIGFLQSEKYFSVHPFRLREEMISLVLSKHPMPRGTIGVHCRRGDYTKKKKYECLPAEWYLRALREHFPDWEDRPVMFISDDTVWLRQEFGHIPNALFPHGGEMEHFVLLASCRDLVISNSTYSWWAARLAESTRSFGMVVRPDRMFTRKVGGGRTDIDLWPERWGAEPINRSIS